MNPFSRMPVHRVLARLHGAKLHDELTGKESAKERDFASLYAAYAESVANASLVLQRNGKSSPQFKAADIESMRLFHHVKKMQGLKKPTKG